jgi:ribose/xylose/arabinose/galactoside ABC-type transport system permease subunit
MYIVSEPFRSIDNVLSIARNFSAYAITGIGVSMVIISGGIDLSWVRSTVLPVLLPVWLWLI